VEWSRGVAPERIPEVEATGKASGAVLGRVNAKDRRAGLVGFLFALSDWSHSDSVLQRWPGPFKKIAARLNTHRRPTHSRSNLLDGSLEELPLTTNV
jgi:hypothetical protein